MIKRFPGLIDVHVHMREPGGAHKEDWDSVTAAALAGGVTLVMAMPNTRPPVTDAESLAANLALAVSKARCDFAQYVGAGTEKAVTIAALAGQAAGLKMYLDQTYGPLRLDDMSVWREHMLAWPKERPICIHAEGRSLAAAVLAAEICERPVHLCHVSTREEILLIRAAKAKGLPITCEVTPHHLFLCDEDIPSIGAGRSEVRPRLAKRSDMQALWDNLDAIDCFATDHAPHTLAEKDGPNPPPGFPGVETMLPLLLDAVSQGRLTEADIISRCYDNPRRIFGLPEQPQTWIEVDTEEEWVITAAQLHSRSGWTPYEGRRVAGKVKRVVLRGREAYADGRVLAAPGYGCNVREGSFADSN